MAAQWRPFATFVVLILTLHSAFSSDLPKSSPAPVVGADSKISSSPAKSPASSPANSSPPAPPPWTISSGSPSPSPALETSPSPSPAANSDDASPSPAPSANARAADAVASDTPEKKSGGMNAGKKAEIALGVLVGVGVVVVAGIIYKKRQNNIQRSQYGYATRSGLI